jgi:hypothetical protein
MKGLKIFVILGLVLMICGLAGSSPIWLNRCNHQFSEAEVNYLMQPYYENLQDYEQTLIDSGKYNENERKELVWRYRQNHDFEQTRERLENAYIPCGSNELSLEEKEAAANKRLGVLDEIYDPPCVFPLPILRLDLEYVNRSDYYNQVNTYHYIGYTVFYIPVIRAFRASAGGYMGICPFSSKCEIP